MRFAAILAAVEAVTAIRVDHLQSALALWDYSLRSCRQIFGEDVGEPNADRILRELKKVGEQGLTRTEISEVFGRNLGAGTLLDALERLRAAGLAFSAEEYGTGRPTERWFHHSAR